MRGDLNDVSFLLSLSSRSHYDGRSKVYLLFERKRKEGTVCEGENSFVEIAFGMECISSHGR